MNYFNEYNPIDLNFNMMDNIADSFNFNDIDANIGNISGAKRLLGNGGDSAYNKYVEILNDTLAVSLRYTPPTLTRFFIIADTMGYKNSHTVFEDFSGTVYVDKNVGKYDDKNGTPLYLYIKPAVRYLVYTKLYPYVNRQFNIVNNMFKKKNGHYADAIAIAYVRDSNKFWPIFYYGDEKMYKM